MEFEEVTIPEAKKIFKAALDQNWEEMERYSSGDDMARALALISPLSEHRDTIIHFLAHSKRFDVLEKIVNQIRSVWDVSFLCQKNVDGNTVLHEAGISGNLKAVKLLVKTNGQLVKMKNEEGETPLFRAAAFGKTKVVRFLASHIDDSDRKDHIHTERKDRSSVLFAAVRGKHFGTALEVLKLFEHISKQEDANVNSLRMLAKMPSSLNSQQQMGIWKKFLYFCIPVGYGHDDDADNIERKFEDTESGLPRQGSPGGCDHTNDTAHLETQGGAKKEQDVDPERGIQTKGPSVSSDHNPECKDKDKKSCLDKVFYQTYLSIWKLINKGCPVARRIWKEKRDDKFADELARELIQKSSAWEKSIMRLRNADRDAGGKRIIPLKGNAKADSEEEEEWEDEEWDTPLLAAIRTGNVEFVKLIIDEYPQALTLCNHMNQNIMHLAAMYRQKEIFNLVEKTEVLTSWLARQIDLTGYTVLHYVADTKRDIGRTRSGPAYQLQAELEWFKRVEKIVPAYYAMLRADNKKTPFEIFKKKHKGLHKEAQQWMKDTSQSCSAVAVLVATVVFAAAFTVPGGTNDANGQPILIHSPIFLSFTVMDVIALSCSLTAVVIFLSILTSPFELDNFHASLPRRLTLGFALLFMSVATTMFAFASTIFLIIHLDDRRPWTTTLICSASFFPVSVLALTHFPLFVSFISAWMFLFKSIWNALHCHSAVSIISKKTKDFLESLRMIAIIIFKV